MCGLSNSPLSPGLPQVSRGATYLQTLDTNYSLSDTLWLPGCHFTQNWLERWRQNCQVFSSRKKKLRIFSSYLHFLLSIYLNLFCRNWNSKLYKYKCGVWKRGKDKPGPMLSWSGPWLMHFSNFWLEFGLEPIKKQTNLSSRHVLLMQISVMSLDLYKPP